MHEFTATYRQIPCESEQGIFLREQGILFAEQGTQGRQQGMGGGLAESCSRRRSDLRGVLCAPCDRGRESSLHQQRRLSPNQPMNKVELEPSKTPPFEQIADLIAGPHTPAWLSSSYRGFSSGLGSRMLSEYLTSKATKPVRPWPSE
jgi:hypothetical protein